MKPLAIFDLDGTLRVEDYDIRDPKEWSWDTFKEISSKSPSHPQTFELMGHHGRKGHDVMVLTARPPFTHTETIDWIVRRLRQYGFKGTLRGMSDIPSILGPDSIFLRMMNDEEWAALEGLMGSDCKSYDDVKEARYRYKSGVIKAIQQAGIHDIIMAYDDCEGCIAAFKDCGVPSMHVNFPTQG